jgi:hypothetical protein
MKSLLVLAALLLSVSFSARAETPQSCASFVPQFSCNSATGLPVVTLTNHLAGSFDPSEIKVTSLTAGVQVTPNPANPLALQLTGVSAGQQVLLDLAAIAAGAGSSEGLDKCCMGELSVVVPPDFICDAPKRLTLSNTCSSEPASADTLDISCEIGLHYEGPPPAPLSLTFTQTGPGWITTAEPLASDNWSCSTSTPEGPIACKIDASLDPHASLQDFTSTLIAGFRSPKSFETCVSASAEGETASACWSTETPRLSLSKTAPETCSPGAPCTFTIALRNPGPADYSGPLSISDGFRQTTPPTPGLGGFTAITPPLCDLADLNAGLCSGEVSLPAGATQTYALDWMPPDLGAAFPDGYAALNCASAASLAGPATGDDMPFDGLEGLACVSVKVPGTSGISRGSLAPQPPAKPADTPLLDLVKSAEPCKVNTGSQSYLCRFKLEMSNAGETEFNGPIALDDRFSGARIKASSQDWTCSATALGAVCDSSALRLAPKTSSVLQMDLSLEGLSKGGSFTNCAAFGLQSVEPSRENVALVQRILLSRGHNIGRVDGKAGAKTRAAVTVLQGELGLAPTGQIDAELLTRLLPAQRAESCVTVDLPPMPAPPLVCDRATTTKTPGQCACRYAGMQRAGKSACTCAKGSTLVAGKGCVRSRTPPKTPTKTPTRPPAPQPELRFCPNGLPEIPGVGCLNINIQKRPRTPSPNCDTSIKGGCF